MRRLALALVTTCLVAAPGVIAEPPPGPVNVPAAPATTEAVAETAVSISVRVVEATPRAARALRSLGTVERTLAINPIPVYDSAALAHRIECWSRTGQATSVSAPRVTTLLGQTGVISIGETIRYLEKYELEAGNLPGESIANPVLGSVTKKGLLIEATPELAPGGVSLTAKFQLTDLITPMHQAETMLGGHKVVVQLPEVSVRSVERRMLLAAGRAVLLADLPPAPPGHPRHVMAWVEARVEPLALPSNFTPPAEKKAR
jgi:hypothetical protein